MQSSAYQVFKCRKIYETISEFKSVFFKEKPAFCSYKRLGGSIEDMVPWL